MSKEPIENHLYRERDFSETFETSLGLLRRNFSTIGKLVVVYVFPLSIASTVLSGWVLRSRSLSSFSEVWFGFALVILINLFTLGALHTVVATVLRRVNASGESGIKRPGFAQEFLAGYPGQLFVVLVMYGITFLSLFLLIIGGPLLGTFFSVAPQAYASEEISAFQAVGRSFRITKKDFSSSFGLVLFAGFVLLVWIGLYGSVLFNLTYQLLGIFTDAPSEVTLLIVENLLYILSGFYTLSWLAVVQFTFGIQYFNLRERIDHIRLKTQLDKVGEHILEARNPLESESESEKPKRKVA